MQKGRIFKSIVCFSIIFVMIIGFVPITAQAADDPAIEANAVVLYELNEGEVLYSKNEKEQIAPASTTKIMTALIAIEAVEKGYIKLTDVVTVPSNIYFDISSDASTANLKTGEELTYKDLLYCVLLASANEACNAVAIFLDGSVDKFIAEMNQRAAELGCTGTHFANTHGMPNDDHYVTAWDLFLIAEEAMKHQLFKDIVSTGTYKIGATNKSKKRELTNTNKLILKDDAYYYEYAIGIKTGYTDKAGYCLVSAAEKDGIRLLSVVMGCKSVKDADGKTVTQSFSETIRLYNWAFENFSYRTILSTSKLISEIPVLYGKDTDSVVLRPQKEITAFIDNNLPLSAFTATVTHYYPTEAGEALSAPVDAGTVLGEVTVTYQGREYGTVKLVANADVEIQRSAYIKAQIKSTLTSKWAKTIMIIVLVLIGLYVLFVVYYNVARARYRRKKRAALAKRREELRQRPTTGKSFEEIESMLRYSESEEDEDEDDE